MFWLQAYEEPCTNIINLNVMMTDEKEERR